MTTFTFDRDKARAWLQGEIQQDCGSRLEDFDAGFSNGSGVSELDDLLWHLGYEAGAVTTIAPLRIGMFDIRSEDECGFILTVDYDYGRIGETRHAGCSGVRDLYIETRKVLSMDEADNVELVLDAVAYLVDRANCLAPAALKLLETMPKVEG